jgi:hypothetical protein
LKIRQLSAQGRFLNLELRNPSARTGIRLHSNRGLSLLDHASEFENRQKRTQGQTIFSSSSSSSLTCLRDSSRYVERNTRLSTMASGSIPMQKKEEKGWWELVLMAPLHRPLIHT